MVTMQEEEDWSEFMADDPTMTGFAHHEKQAIRISNEGPSLNLDSVPRLSPLDMVYLSNGDHDATGHVVWMGAYLFIEAFVRPLPIACGDDGELSCEKRTVLAKLRRECFLDRRVLELGCGTGAAGLSVVVGSDCRPSEMVLTDSDPDVLDLCRRNVLLVGGGDRAGSSAARVKCTVETLAWGSDMEDESNTLTGAAVFRSGPLFDTAIAADVIYDISALEPLLQTVSKTLRKNGHFILSYVPRSFSYATGEYVKRKAKSIGGLDFRVSFTPKELSLIFRGQPALNSTSFEEMEEAGAIVLVFQNPQVEESP